MARIDKDNFIEFGIDYSRYSTPHAVAGQLGFSDVHTRGALGFRLHWHSLKQKGCFEGCRTIGDYYNAYLGHHITGEKR